MAFSEGCCVHTYYVYWIGLVASVRSVDGKAFRPLYRATGIVRDQPVFLLAHRWPYGGEAAGDEHRATNRCQVDCSEDVK